MDFRITLSAFFNLNMPIFIPRIDFMAHAIRFEINSEIIFNWYIAYEYFSKRNTHLENKLYDVVEWNIFSKTIFIALFHEVINSYDDIFHTPNLRCSLQCSLYTRYTIYVKFSWLYLKTTVFPNLSRFTT